MLQEVSNYIKSNNLIEAGDRIVIGVSGGADSICLLHVLYELYHNKGAELIVVHINHGIRGEEANQDEEFVRGFTKRLGIECYSFWNDVKQIAKKEGLSEEEAGRNVRYRSFLEVCQTRGCNKIAVAHNKNDNAETVLFHLFRGSGIKGLSGIDPVRRVETDSGGVSIIRPLLFVSREEIEHYLRDHEIPYRIDQTNLEDDYSRNKLRNQVLTYVTREINSKAISHIAEAAARLAEAEEYIDQQVRKHFNKLVKQNGNDYCFVIQDFEMEEIVIQKGILLKIMEELAGSRKDIETKHVEDILSLMNRQVGKHISLPYGICAFRDYHEIRLYLTESVEEEENPSSLDLELTIPGTIYLEEYRIFLRTDIIPYEKGMQIPKNSCTKWFDYDKIENAVKVRTRKEGDFLQINDQGGNKKLKDYFIDLKIPKRHRDSILMIADGDHIMWILTDGRMSAKYKICEKTKNILVMNIIDAEEKHNGR